MFVPAIFWKGDVPLEGWLFRSGWRYPSGFEPACPKCGAGFRDILYQIFHPALPGKEAEVCRPCADSIADPGFSRPDVEEAWVRVDLLALDPDFPIKGAKAMEPNGLDMEENEFSVKVFDKQAASLAHQGLGLVPSDFEMEDLNSLEGKGWRISGKGNLFSHQRDFHLVIFPDRVNGFKLMIDGVVGKLKYPSASRASACGLAAVRELLCRGVIPQKLRSQGGGPVTVQPEFSLR